MKNNKPQLHISLSREHKKFQSDISDSFKAFDVTFDGGLMRLSEMELPMQLIICLGGWVVSNVAWDLFKAGIKQVYKKFSNARVTIQDDKSVMYSVQPDLTVRTIVIPDRSKEFEHIKTIDDLVTHLKNIAKNNILDEWSLLPAGDIFTFIKSYAFSRDNLENNTLNNEGIGNIHYGDIHSTFSSPSIDLKKVSVPMIKDGSFVPKSEDLLKDGDLIMADASEDYEGVGVTVSVHGLENKKIVGGLHTFVLRDNKNKTNPYFRQYIFRNPIIRNSLQKVANGVSVYGISKTEVSKILLPIPPLPEQNRIVAVLETWDKAIEKLTQKIEVKKSVKKGLMQKLLTGKARLPGFSDEWETKKLSETGKLIMGQSPIGKSYTIQISDMPLLNGATELKEKGIFVTKYTNMPNKVCKKNDLLFCIRATIGNLQLADREYCLGRGVAALSVFDSYNRDFISYVLLELFEIMKSMSAGGVIKGLKRDEIGNLKVNMPKKEEQTAIASILTTTDKEIEELERKLALLEDQKKYLLNNLITGKIRTPEDMKC